MVVYDPRGVDARISVVSDEVPVSVGDQELHIDGVLELRSEVFLHPRRRVFVVVECKRSDPNLSRWCFAPVDERKRPVVLDTYWHRRTDLIEAVREIKAPFIAAGARSCALPTTQVGVELKNARLDGNGVGKTLNEAITQAMRGASGLANDMLSWIEADETAIVIPMVVTTAQLFASKTVLSAAALTTGELAAVSVEQPPFLWYTTNISRSLMPSVSRPGQADRSIANKLAHRSMRSVLVANQSGLVGALTQILQATTNLDELP